VVIKEARPTEYKGILYRSKSEAMFARYLELQNEYDVAWFSRVQRCWNLAQSGFIYEPELLKVGRWTPDFVRWSTMADTHNHFWLPELSYEVIEYKPSRPTDTYIAEFVERINKLGEKLQELDGATFASRMTGGLYYGNIWAKERKVIRVVLGPSEDEDGNLSSCWYANDYDQNDWLQPFEDQVKAVRFDLVAADEGGV